MAATSKTISHHGHGAAGWVSEEVGSMLVCTDRIGEVACADYQPSEAFTKAPPPERARPTQKDR
jgi:hypothetical protein